MRILVTYASKHGSTEEVAEAVAERLREAGLLTHLVPAAEVEDLDGYDGVRGDLVPASFAERLSARELEVLLLLDQHLSTEEIAARLFISEHTVRSHVKSLLRKLDVSSRREALDVLARARS